MLGQVLAFKGGTCAAMRGVLDRFSIDLDFDYLGKPESLDETDIAMESLFAGLGLTVKTRSTRVPQFFLRYPNPVPNDRNTLKVDISTNPPGANRYEPVRLFEIDRILRCQTVETMFANKLVALIERYEVRGVIAGRDLYDVHHYFLQGLQYDESIIRERRNASDITTFLSELIDFIRDKVNQTVIIQDLNVLLPYETFSAVRSTIKDETIMFLQDEIHRHLME